MIQKEMEQIIAGALLLFERVDNLDLNLLKKCLEISDELYIEDIQVDKLDDFISVQGNCVRLKEGLSLDDTLDDSFTVRQKLEEIAGLKVKEYCKNIDMNEFVLTKMSQLGSIPVENMEQMFSDNQISSIQDLVDHNYIIFVWNNDVVYDDYLEAVFTYLGKKELFVINNKDKVEKFKQLIQVMRYDDCLIDDFLKTQDLDQTAEKVLTLNNFIDFCNEYDRCIVKEGVDSINYERLIFNKDTLFDENSIKRIKDMLEVWDDDHCIYICHPNHLFFPNHINKGNKDIKYIDWSNINVSKMFDKKDYYLSVSPECTNAFKYVHNRLGHIIMKEMNDVNNDAVGCLVVVEKYIFDNDENYLVRGIIKGDKEGYSLAFNPEYEKSIPRNIWEKSQRFCGNEVPVVYLKRRNN